MTLYGLGENGLADDEETGFFMSVLSELPLRSLKHLFLSLPSSSFQAPSTSRKLTSLLLHHFNCHTFT